MDRYQERIISFKKRPYHSFHSKVLENALTTYPTQLATPLRIGQEVHGHGGQGAR